ncbi:glycosyltransferase family 2 protein [Enterobacter ludwigii]
MEEFTLRSHKYQLAILVLLYNKKPSESTSFISLDKTLQQLNTSYNNVQICLWNNGPDKFDTKDDLTTSYYSTAIVETINNESLSVIYNKFLARFDSEKYLILDHDSFVSSEYINECLNDSFEYIIPTIITQNGVQSPKIYNLKSYVNNKTLLGIGSGICLTNHACSMVKNKFKTVFDERFYLYGVDSTFFLRLNKIGQADKIKISKSTIFHSLSKFEDENKTIKKFREKERSYDQALTLRYYFSVFTFVTTFKKIIGCIFLNKSDINLFIFLAALVSGKHYKSIKS